MKPSEARKHALMMRDERTGDIVEVPPPDEMGRGVVIFNGQVVERCEYSDSDGGFVKTDNGRIFRGKEWANHIVEQLRIGAYRI